MDPKALNRILLGALAGVLLGGGIGAAADVAWGVTGPKASECYDSEWRASVDRRLTGLSQDVAVLLDRSNREQEEGPSLGRGAGRSGT